MDERRVALQGLHEVRLQGVAQQRRECAHRIEVTRCDGAAVLAPRHHHFAQPPRQVLPIPRQAQHGHQLGSGGDVEAGLPMLAPPHRQFQRAQGAVIHVEGAPPSRGRQIHIQRVAPVEMVVEQRGKQVVGGGHSVQVAVEV